jgi:hypothetical protein
MSRSEYDHLSDDELLTLQAETLTQLREQIDRISSGYPLRALFELMWQRFDQMGQDLTRIEREMAGDDGA